ncbi:MAG: carbamoyl-phosphate synthase (glutamine-hydrolyzing) large subunit [Bacillota bacterium]|uniref:carbamoyl-phosphate synthase (glutamine-hydrolyzing) large subunit n=1 Tax=unclassified Virgibacillus TaxID=2620237 RepID=UPI000EF462DE|nr:MULTISPECIES: carbamoyl-phosphate synthase (glutamine-hydrolyzing) large subunit [unclassified Virgibacillus]MDY7046280.1 carbamoyl-phosphate synthase (glutamine-hydrolyzing) large subunit [Virgibacillus sp. M23]
MRNCSSLKKVLVIGSGPIVIGQAAEFDYAGTQACLALKEEGIEVILANNNPATIMTDKHIADKVYMEPLQVESLATIIAKEKPDGLIGTLGGQTGLNLTIALHDQGILEEHQVNILGTSVQSIRKGESREEFRQLMLDLHEPVSQSKVVETLEEGLDFVKEIGYPVILRPAYTLGGEGGGFAYNEPELMDRLQKALELSPIQQVLVERSIKGWKEIEYEVIRDVNDTCVIVCNMENIDPVGVHTGDSMVVAPSQTLSDTQYQLLRSSSLKVIRALGVVGGCNIQFALNPHSNDYYIIEVNPRVSRSSALASKATGYPIARIATKCAIGQQLDEIINPITGNTYASFEPALDYCVVKLPRFSYDKFTEADRTLGTQMKATGEVMAIDRTFEGALNKAVRSLELNVNSMHWPKMTQITFRRLQELLETPNDLRLFAINEAFKRGWNVWQIKEMTQIDLWYLRKIEHIVLFEQWVAKKSIATIDREALQKAKRFNISDERIAFLLGVTSKEIRARYEEVQLKPVYKLVDTCAGEFDAVTPYYYSTWHGQDEVAIKRDKKKILVLGSGPIRIGQGVEFDYCSVHAALAVKKLGYEAIVINNNPETVSTDYSIADRLYFEPLALEDVLHVARKEGVEGVILQFGGQTAINLANDLKREGIKVMGTLPEHIDQMEDREQFYHLLDTLSIDHMKGDIVKNLDELTVSINELGFPVLIRPSYVIGGQSMFICNNKSELHDIVDRIQYDTNDRCWPLLIDSYLPGKECEMDVISDGSDIVVPGIFEHVEKAGVHSGDSMAMFPPFSLSKSEKEEMTFIARQIASSVPIIGIMNIQFVIHKGVVYVLEVNPRASRTVPIMSKVTDIAMVELAVKVQLGHSIKELSSQLNLCAEPSYVTLKAPIFSAGKLKGVDHLLGPEMKSTGEIITISQTKEEVFSKVLSIHMKLHTTKKPLIFVSIAERMKAGSLARIQSCIQTGASIMATQGTADYLASHGLTVIAIPKDRESIFTAVEKLKPDIILNIPEQGRKKGKMGFYLRELAVRFQTPCFTSLETFEALVMGGQTIKNNAVHALQDYLNCDSKKVNSK